MNSAVISGHKKQRVNLTIPYDLATWANRVRKELDLTLSELHRSALRAYLENFERRKIEEELEEGYRANYEYYSKMTEEWKFADTI